LTGGRQTGREGGTEMGVLVGWLGVKQEGGMGETLQLWRLTVCRVWHTPVGSSEGRGGRGEEGSLPGTHLLPASAGPP
jgi:hypothetical protein